MKTHLLPLAAAALLVACNTEPAAPADTIYFGGDIITINDAQPSVEAVAIKDGRIRAVGTRTDIERGYKGKATVVVDLAGKTLLPGFLDPHSHYINSLTMANQVNVFAPPAGPGKDVEAIVAEIVKFRDARKIPDGETIMAYGYDETSMPGGRTLTRDDLDRDFPNNPVMVGHTSLHGAVLNSAAFKKYGISAATKTPPGGIIVRKKGSNEPEGLVMETAWIPIFSSLPKPTPEQEVEWSKAGQMIYAAAGVTTAQEGATHAGDIAIMQRAAAGGATIIDVIAFPFILDLDAVLKANPVSTFGSYTNHLKLGGVKITLDGSPQGRTAFFTRPISSMVPTARRSGGGAALPAGHRQRLVQAGVRPAACRSTCTPMATPRSTCCSPPIEYAAAGSLDKDRRTTIIHSQFVRLDQLDSYVAYRFIPSFFTEHTFYFGETHVKQLGQERAFFLSPMRAAIDKGLRPTNHTDYNVSPIDQMFVVWTAVNRVSRGGEVIGPDQRVTPLEALKAITINAAYQYFEENSKGSIEPGKLADLVILDKNPLTVNPMAIKDIKVVETIKEGRTIYVAP